IAFIFPTPNKCRMCTNGTNLTCNVELLQGLLYCPVFLLGFLINAAALRAFIAKRDHWTDTHIYMINLAIADSTFILFIPFRIYDAFFCLPKTRLCTFLIHFHYCNMYASILTTAFIAVHRYLAIRFPLQTRFWSRKKETSVCVCVLIWTFLVTINFVFQDANKPEYLWTCYERCDNKTLDARFLVVIVFVGFLLPFLIIAFCSSQIIWIIFKVHNKSEEMKSIARMVTANMIVFFVCFTPVHIGFVLNYFHTPPLNWESNFSPTHTFFFVSEWIASTNCCFDAFGYYFLLTRYYL
uniref:G-protein coupled receptors family 1 profile domain-containing protein n=1 Tax=Oryzias sinensis TaxID=183150 RepID=A0A8C8A965_9TELE